MYRDHPEQDPTFITRVSPFTGSVGKMREYVGKMEARGGGDGPEAVADGMYEASVLQYRKEATKICILIADAPPHGIEPSGDGLPTGWDTHDPLVVARNMAKQGIVLYTVACEPSVSRQYQFCRDFLISVAELTEGQAIALSDAKLLADVILGGAQEEMGLAALQRDMDLRIHRAIESNTQARMRGDRYETDVDTLVEKCSIQVASEWRSAKVQTKQMRTNAKYTAGKAKKFFSASPSLKAARSAMTKEGVFVAAARAPSGSRRSFGRSAFSACAAPRTPASRTKSKRRGSYGIFGSRDAAAETSMAHAPMASTSVAVERDTISMEQCLRMGKKSYKRGY